MMQPEHGHSTMHIAIGVKVAHVGKCLQKSTTTKDQARQCTRSTLLTYSTNLEEFSDHKGKATFGSVLLH